MNSSEQEKVEPVKFCPVCGDTMHKEERDAGLWFVCDDPSCDYQMVV